MAKKSRVRPPDDLDDDYEEEERQNLGARVNSELDEYHPSLSPDGKVLFFVRHSYEPWIPGDIYRIPVREVGHWMLPGEE